MNNFLLQKWKTDLHLKSQEVKSFNPSTRRHAIHNILLQLFEKAVMGFYTDIENYKLHWISIHNHYIYTQASSKKADWLRIYKWKPHRVQDSNMPGRQSPTPVFKRGRSAGRPKPPRAARASVRCVRGMGAVTWAAVLKFSLVMPANKVSFGEWVKRQMSCRNATENKTRMKNENEPNHWPCAPRMSSCFTCTDGPLSRPDLNRTYGFTITSIYQLSCSNKYLISTDRLTFLIRF